MASANEPGKLRVLAKDTKGQMFELWKGRSNSAINAGKSPDGVLANLTADKQVILRTNRKYVLTGGVKILVEFTPDATDGLDVSDGVYQICFTDAQSGNDVVLDATDLGITTDLTPVAATPQMLGTGYTIPDGQSLYFGGNTPTVISVEDDTA